MIKVLIAVIAGTFLVSFGLFMDDIDSLTADEVKGYEIGDNASDFSLKNIDDNFVSLSDYKDKKGVIVIFTCNSCPYANMYEERIIALHEKFAPKGYPVLAIMPNDVSKKPSDSFSNMKKRASEKSYMFPYVYDETQSTAKRFGATKTPHVFLLNNQNKPFEVSFIGAIDDNVRNANAVKAKYVENAISEIDRGVAVSKTSAIAVGCTIKWKKLK